MKNFYRSLSDGRIAFATWVTVMTLSFLLSGSSCSHQGSPPDSSPAPSPTVPVSTTLPPQAPATTDPLAWEYAHPERAAWSAALSAEVTSKFDLFDKASDSAFFCKNYAALSTPLKIKMWSEMVVAVAYYECDWDPKSYSVDVGTGSNKDTWSVGLLQMSVTDQANYGFKFGYNFADLQDPAKNLKLGIAVMGGQLSKKGKILIPKGEDGLYWATLHPGGKYDKSAEVAARVKKRIPECDK